MMGSRPTTGVVGGPCPAVVALLLADCGGAVLPTGELSTVALSGPKAAHCATSAYGVDRIGTLFT